MQLKYTFVMGLILALMWAFPATAKASGLTHLDAVLVMDASGSMNASDPNRLSTEAMMLFIDMLSVRGDRVGIVSYTDRIVASKELTLIDGYDDKQALKSFIQGLQVGGWTDITVGLMEAIRILDEGRADPAAQNNQPVIIMLTDGNNALPAGSPRTEADLDRDTEQIIVEARQQGYAIYTIGLNYDGTVNLPYIRRFADETGGLSFDTASAADLPDILSAIFASQMELRIIEAGLLHADGDWQEMTIDIPDSRIVEANIIFLSQEPVDVQLLDPLGRPIPFDGYWAVFSQSRVYSLLKVITPAQGTWTLRVRGVTGDQIRINLLYQYSLEIAFTVSDETPTAGDTIRAEIVFLEGGQPAEDATLYQQSTVTVYLSDVTAAVATAAQAFPAAYVGGAFAVDIPIPAAATYLLTARVEHPNFFREAEPIVLTASAAPVPLAIPTPVPTPAPAPEVEPVPETADFPWLWAAVGGGVALTVLLMLLILLLRRKAAGRVFTGKLVIEVTDHYTREKSSPQYRNLIEYGRKTDLLTLLGETGGSPALGGVLLYPSPTAPSHLPQLIVKCAHKGLKFKKDFLEQDATKGLALGLRSELTIQLEAENKSVHLRYVE